MNKTNKSNHDVSEKIEQEDSCLDDKSDDFEKMILSHLTQVKEKLNPEILKMEENVEKIETILISLKEK
jgi:hypothetical protein